MAANDTEALRALVDAAPDLGDPANTGHGLLFEVVMTREEHAAYVAALSAAEAALAAQPPAVIVDEDADRFVWIAQHGQGIRRVDHGSTNLIVWTPGDIQSCRERVDRKRLAALNPETPDA